MPLEPSGTEQVQQVNPVARNCLLVGKAGVMSLWHGPDVDNQRSQFVGAGPNGRVGPRIFRTIEQLAVQHQDVMGLQAVPLAVVSEPWAI